MSVEVTREEFEARVGTLEREVEGEKLVTRHILEQTRRNGDDLAAVKTRLDRLEGKVDGLEHKLDGVERKLDDLSSNLPQIVGEVMREVIGGKAKKR
jgi:tetrahydromethanopterin S-methyltransferase subunit G